MNSVRPASPLIEPLEQRISPALLVNGANLLGGAGSPSTGETSVGGNAVTIVKVLSGQALVWFDNGDILGISVGPNAKLEITGDVEGDIIANLTADGRLSDSDHDPLNGEDGRVLLPNNILGIKTAPLSSQRGDITNIITGGSISNISINGAIEGIYAGDGVFRPESHLPVAGTVSSSLGALDFNPVEAGTQSTFTLTQNDGLMQPGASISTVQIAKGRQLQVFAGSGNPNGATFPAVAPNGGSIKNITVESAFVPAGAPDNTPSYSLMAGDGAAGGTKAGAGGNIEVLVEKTSVGPVLIQGGQGGNGLAGGAGGNGGSIINIDVQSDSSRYTVIAGNGGSGTPGGAGGSLSTANFSNRTPLGGVIVAADFTGDGADDIIVADQGTGQMVLNANNGDGSDFTPVVQHLDNGVPVYLIDPAGDTPSDATAADIDGDGKIDLIVAFKNSSDFAIYFNQGNGSFWDPAKDPDGGWATLLAGTGGLAPTKIALLSEAGNTIALAGNSDGKGYVKYSYMIRDLAGISFSPTEGVLTLSQPITDIVRGGAGLFASLGDGSIIELNVGSIAKPFTVGDTVSVRGGISDLDVDEAGERLLAVSPTGRTLNVFTISPADQPDAPALVPLATIPIANAKAKPLIAHFSHDGDDQTDDQISLLSGLTAGAQIDLYTPVLDDGDPLTPDGGYALTGGFTTGIALKNFVPAYSIGGEQGLAALASSLSQFSFADGFDGTAEYSLPFASKKVAVIAGHGGDGLDVGKKIGNGGAGGSIRGINADAHEIDLGGGAGGDSQTGPAGAGGSIVNPLNFTTTTGIAVAPMLLADVKLNITCGTGGAPSADGLKASGGAGGSIQGLALTLSSGDIFLTSGDGGLGRGGAGGAGGSITGLKTIARDGSLTLTAGAGGSATTGLGNGGAGGIIKDIRHELTLEPEAEDLEKPYSVALTAGAAGGADKGLGGAGGSITGVKLLLDGADRTYDAAGNPPLVDAHRDSTVRVSLTAGAGGTGAKGGLGGSIAGLAFDSIFDQRSRSGGILLNYVVLGLTAGAGGVGRAGPGGDGGGIAFSSPISGVTFFDPDAPTPADNPSRVPLILRAGDGGHGSLKGGAGGNISGLVAQNAPFFDGSVLAATLLQSAILNAGNGGASDTADGGKGGSITRTLLGAQNGYLSIRAGDGGTALGALAGKGGAGGLVGDAEFGLVSTGFNVGMTIGAGDGGTGNMGGGAGGNIANLRINTPQSTLVPSALIVAGDGGAANAAKALGGKGGDISGITQAKDINSSINLIQAGSGGANAPGKGGLGGNVANVRTVGFIGRPSDGFVPLGAFDLIFSGGIFVEIPQGLFAGRGGDGATDGAAGSITNIAARQIAALGAAMDPLTQLFAPALKVTGVKADLIGFDAARDGAFDDTLGTALSASQQKPADGFILATALASITTANPARTTAFTFTV